MKTLHYVASENESFCIPFPNENTFDAACDWYNRTNKATQISFCRARGFELVATNGRLLEDWATLSMMVYAWQNQLPSAAALLEGFFAVAQAHEGV